MTNSNRNDDRMPLMDNEEIEMSFGEKHGLEAESMSDQKRIVLTDRRLMRFSRSAANKDMAFMSLEDIQVAEVQRTFSGKRLLLRIALLWAGAGSALATITFLPLAIPLATVLALAGGYHLLRYLSVSQEGTILFHAGQDEIGISFDGDMANQAYTFVNHFFYLKEALSSARETNEGQLMEPVIMPVAVEEEHGQETTGVEEETVFVQDSVTPMEYDVEVILPTAGQNEENKTSEQA
jgi:hypothetical protein